MQGSSQSEVKSSAKKPGSTKSSKKEIEDNNNDEEYKRTNVKGLDNFKGEICLDHYCDLFSKADKYTQTD